MDKIRNHWLFFPIVGSIGYLTIFLVSFTYEEELMKKSLIQIQNQQESINDGLWLFWKIYTDVGGSTLQMLYMASYIVFMNDNPEGMILVAQLFGVELYLINLFKIGHAKPRPFWISEGKFKDGGPCSA